MVRLHQLLQDKMFASRSEKLEEAGQSQESFSGINCALK